MAPTLDEFKKLSVEDQGILFLKRLAHNFRRGQTFKRSNLALSAHGTPDAYSLCTGWPREDLAEGVRNLLGTPWRTIERHGYIAESLSGDSNFEVTPHGWALVEARTSILAPNRTVIDALRFLHPALQGYEHCFREAKLKEAVTAAFMRVENRLNQIRETWDRRNVTLWSLTERRNNHDRNCPAHAKTQRLDEWAQPRTNDRPSTKGLD